MRYFRNPANGYTEHVDSPFICCLFFGCFYFAVKGVWSHAIIAFGLAVLTGGFSWLVYPFFAGQVVTNSYLRRGWIDATDLVAEEKRKAKKESSD